MGFPATRSSATSASGAIRAVPSRGGSTHGNEFGDSGRRIVARNVCEYVDEDGIGCTNAASRKYCQAHKPLAEALKKRRQREAKRQSEEIDLAAVSDTPLARKALGLPPKGDDVTVRFASRHDGAPLVDYTGGFQGIAGLSERVESPYGVQARMRAQAEARDKLDDVVDYSEGSGHVPPAQRDRSRRERLLRRLTNAERRDATVREAKIRHMEAAEDGELESRNEIIDWSQVTEDGHLPEQPQEDLDPRSVRFTNPWSGRASSPWEGESVTLDLRK
jgi:hypothetical protein